MDNYSSYLALVPMYIFWFYDVATQPEPIESFCCAIHIWYKIFFKTHSMSFFHFNSPWVLHHSLTPPFSMKVSYDSRLFSSMSNIVNTPFLTSWSLRIEGIVKPPQISQNITIVVWSNHHTIVCGRSVLLCTYRLRDHEPSLKKQYKPNPGAFCYPILYGSFSVHKEVIDQKCAHDTCNNTFFTGFWCMLFIPT